MPPGLTRLSQGRQDKCTFRYFLLRTQVINLVLWLFGINFVVIMGVEIERKFLVRGDGYKAESHEAVRITQGYLSSVPERSVRVRIRGEKGFITIKGAGDASGVARYEWEKEIALNDAEELLRLCEPGVIEKTRYLVTMDGFTFEVDEFHGDNEGLVMAEVELPVSDACFPRPAWLGQEVTGDPRYYNVMLKQHPFKTW